MKVGLCSVGTELVHGDLTDTNAVWLAQRLTAAGIDVAWHVAVADDHQRLVEAVRWLVERCDAVVVGGGLGPTDDDLTRPALAEIAGVQLELRDDLAERIETIFAGFGRRMPSANLRQAEVPEGALALDPVGTAPGFVVEVGGSDRRACRVYALPGVPAELRQMFEWDVLPDLVERAGSGARITRTVHVSGMGESRVAETVLPVSGRLARAAQDPADELHGVTLAFLAGTDAVRVRVSAAAATADEARKRTDPVLAEIVALLGDAVSGLDDEGLEDRVAQLLRRLGLTVATAESCPAGLVAARLASVAGATGYLRGGIVTYGDGTKTGVLGVDRAVIDEHGPVSEAVTGAMAVRAREVFSADLGLAVTCVAGPATQGGREVGTVVWAVAGGDDDLVVRELRVPGDRPAVQARAATIALEGLRRHLARRVVDAG